MDAAGQLAELVEPLRELRPARGDRSSRAAGGSLSSVRLDDAQVERDRHEPLLRAVVQVALEPPALGVAGLDDARARRGQLLVGVGVRERLGDQLGEVAQALLGALRERVGRPGARGERAPEVPADVDRGGHRGAVARRSAASRRGSRPRPRTPTRCGLSVRSTFATTVSPSRSIVLATGSRSVPSSLQPPDDRRRAGALVAHQARPGHAQQQRDLLGHLLEHAARRRSRWRRAWRPGAAPPARPRARAGTPRSP